MKTQSPETQMDAVLDWMHGRSSLLLLTHTRPDGDAFGTLIGLLRLLNADGRWEASAYMSTPVPERYNAILPHDTSLAIGKLPEQRRHDGIVCLDTARADRIDAPNSTHTMPLRIEQCNIDHHPDNSLYGAVNWINPESTATAQMILRLADSLNLAMVPEAATALLFGLVTDCGTFRFQNTSPQALRDAARLIECGGAYHAIVDTLHFRQPYGRLLIQSKLLETADFAYNGRLVYSVLREEDLQGADVSRSIDGVEIACLLQPEDDGVRFSLRARSARYSVGPIARELGGGGHQLAAGARLRGVTVAEARERLVALTRKVFAS
ncbi:MAG: DHH family phosphoesterase [Candidatus Pacebacteria bacterium]|nr:DHH family phosphoesterase [Candidatus Paceibacterota bacterium]